ncbi:ABC transporter ATP-binding protein [Evansella tamaricis]|uniref:ABC transporter ATP-binding protein n=1 Tax=Evansella tamaricis TaxID=2069301 RepID=A0ABS6JJS1_9BACI|nr:ABC transporter ATP-binding protein [Evansella tamaricis]MBU9713926.1 ABC transporter ATP-binding protein [Evansella tamaricis]
MNVVRVEGLTKHFKKFHLGPLNFKVEKGTAVGLVGSNGSGKSTFFRLLMNLVHADGGTVEIFGKKMPSSEIEIKQSIGFAANMLEPFYQLSIKEISSHFSYWYPSWNQNKYEDLINRYKLDEGEKFGKCSTGMKKKVDFIFSLSHEPELLLLDEPTAGVDLGSQKKMKEDLIEFLEDGEKSLIMSTHLIDDLKQICDNIIILSPNGKVQDFLRKEEVEENWAKFWVSELTEELRCHPHVIKVNDSQHPSYLLTDQKHVVEKELREKGISVISIQRLPLDEIIEFQLDS